jgi:uncharacterized protein
MMDRRLFLKFLLASFFTPKLALGEQRYGTVLVGGMKQNISSENYFVLFDLDQRKLTKIPVDFKIHEVILNPYDRNEVSCVGQWLNQFCKIDLINKRVANTYKISSSNEKFVGHGVYTPDGNILATVAQYSNDRGSEAGLGKIYCLNKDLKKLGEFPSFGLEPHDVKLLGKDLIVFNASIFNDQRNFSKIDSCISIIDWQNEKLIKHINLENKSYSMAHFFAKSTGEIFGVGGRAKSENQLAPLILKINESKIIADLESIDGNSPFLSIQLDRNFKILAATLPGEQKIFFWDLKTGKKIKNIYLKTGVTGLSVTLNNKFFVANGNGGIHLIDIKKLIISKTIHSSEISFQGAHSKII